MIKVTEPITFAEGFDEFIYTKNIEGCRPATIKHYKNSIHVFLLYHDENMRMDEITSFTVSNFFCQLQNRGLAEKTLCTYILVYDDLAQNMEDFNPLEKLKKQSEKIPGAKF